MDSAGVVLIALAAFRAGAEGNRIDYHPPRRGADCSRYLFRMGLHAELERLGIDSALTKVAKHEVGDRLMEIRSFVADDDGVHALADQVLRILQRASVAPSVVRSLVAGIMEVGSNVAEHSWSPRGYVALQQYDVGRKSHRISFCIADTGVGLRRSLSRSHHVTSDVDAVELAVTRGVSGTGVPGRGTGLADVLGSTATGSLLVWSGRGWGVFRGAAAGREEISGGHVDFAGTFIHATVGVS